MAGELLQSAAVGVIVLGAAGTLAVRGWRMLSSARGKPGDDGCGGGGCGCGKG
ncbi:MAG TPA: hypothetical protein VK358_13885 [Longimicrobium sp.]|nr:hypothetical protein [Longimicrobium sp.]